MALKTILDTLDGVDDAVKPFYAEADGKFVLKLEGVDAHPDVANLKSAYEKVKDKVAEASAEAKAAKADLAEALKGKPDEAALIAERQRLEKERDDAMKDRDDALGKLTGVTRDSKLTEALTASGITDPAFIKGATAMLRDQIKMVDGNPVVETDMGPKALADHVKHWAAGEGKSFVTPPSGGGSKGSPGGSPAGQKRSSMTPEEKGAYQREHGQEAYLQLPK